jgi:predicted Zn finger-like uncharacterized protein
MSFNVTQCPACESTFNTNSRVLAVAAGRVRCGACLNVFEAIDNFLISEEADAAPDQDESVFVGNDPQEYFDPSSFLTRSALSETQADEPGRADPIDEKYLHQKLKQSETLSKDFFATVAAELRGKTQTPAVQDSHEYEEEPQTGQPESQQASIANESIDEEFENEVVDFFTAEATEFTEDDPAYSSLEERFESEPELQPEPEPTDVEVTHIEREEPFLSMGLSASITSDPHAPPEVRISEHEPETPAELETTSALDVATDAEVEFGEDNQKLPLATQNEAPDLEPAAEPPYDSVSSQINDEVTRPPSNAGSYQAFTLEQGDEATIESHPTAESGAVPEPITDPAADTENPSLGSELPSDAADESQNLVAQEEPASESIAEDEEPTIEATQTSVQEVDEDLTQVIRARALEAELSDEEALEAIPLENLAALGSMSTPVELLARKESRLLRSTLLFLSILLLGGLLSSQYLWQRMELYSQLPQFRPGYEIACTYVNCALPQYTDIDSIRSENLTVRTHPSRANGLMINTVIRNTAEFEQPFPILILSFNSVENSVIALREFTSTEYLDAGLRSIQAMPPKTPVQISLAIMDPGPEAVNYTLAFRWP